MALPYISTLRNELFSSFDRAFNNNHVTELEAIEAVALALMDILASAGDLRPLAPQVELLREVVLRAIDQARTQVGQAPIVDFAALVNAILTMTRHHQADLED